MKLHWDHVEWGYPYVLSNGETEYYYYVYWFNWIGWKHAYWGREDMYYDGPHSSFGLGPINVSWRLPWTRHEP